MTAIEDLIAVEKTIEAIIADMSRQSEVVALSIASIRICDRCGEKFNAVKQPIPPDQCRGCVRKFKVKNKLRSLNIFWMTQVSDEDARGLVVRSPDKLRRVELLSIPGDILVHYTVRGGIVQDFASLVKKGATCKRIFRRWPQDNDPV